VLVDFDLYLDADAVSPLPLVGLIEADLHFALLDQRLWRSTSTGRFSTEAKASN
jgi:hypothetical protein